MTPEEYAAQQTLISAAVARYVQQFASLFARVELGWPEWIRLLNVLYPEVESRRSQAAELARQFYDSQRDENYPNVPRNNRPLEGYRFEWFVENMEPARKRMSQIDSRADAVALMALRAVREVENAGRKQIIHAVENDPEPDLIRGWAREATGRETCAWCLMLVSRGPVYMGADTAGLNLDDDTAARMIAAGEDVSEHMQEWHTGCDCKVVPVFKVGEWHGQKAADRALDLWNDATKVAIREEEDEDESDRTHNYGKNKGKEFTRNQRAINALRRRLDRGEIQASEFAALAA